MREWKKHVSQISPNKRKRIERGRDTFPIVEDELLDWIDAMYAENQQVTLNGIQQKTLSIIRECGEALTAEVGGKHLPLTEQLSVMCYKRK